MPVAPVRATTTRLGRIGTVELGSVIVCPASCQPAFWNALAVSFPEMFDSLPTASHRYHDWLLPLVRF